MRHSVYIAYTGGLPATSGDNTVQHNTIRPLDLGPKSGQLFRVPGRALCLHFIRNLSTIFREILMADSKHLRHDRAPKDRSVVTGWIGEGVPCTVFNISLVIYGRPM